jgi:hypothetical protein
MSSSALDFTTPGETHRNAMETEFARWKDGAPLWQVSTGGPSFVRTQPHVHAGDPGGLPSGRQSRFVGPYFDFDDTDLHLVQRTAGGVAVVRCERDIHRNTLWQTADSLLQLDGWLHHTYPAGHDVLPDMPPAHVGMINLRDWVRSCLVSLYDPTDPDEAAEQTLLVLAGRVRTPPRACF